MQRNKTMRRRVQTQTAHDTGLSQFQEDTVVKSTEDSLDALFAAETTNTFQQPWQKLNRGSRLDRLRKFVRSYPDLTPAEQASLLTAVLQAYELRQLNTKLAVEYDPTSATITSIRGLKERASVSGLRTFRIETLRTTLKQKKEKDKAKAILQEETEKEAE